MFGLLQNGCYIHITKDKKIETKKKFHHRMFELLEAYTFTRGCWIFPIWTLNRNTSIHFYLQSIDCSFKRATMLCWRIGKYLTSLYMKIYAHFSFVVNINITIPCQIFINLTSHTISRWLCGFVPHLETI